MSLNTHIMSKVIAFCQHSNIELLLLANLVTREKLFSHMSASSHFKSGYGSAGSAGRLLAERSVQSG